MTRHIEQRIADLETERDMLLDKVKAFEELFDADVPLFRERLGITRSQAVLLSMLYKTRFMRRSTAMAVMYGHKIEPPQERLIDVWLSRLRKVLRPIGVTVRNVTCEGWYISDDDKKVLER